MNMLSLRDIVTKVEENLGSGLNPRQFDTVQNAVNGINRFPDKPQDTIESIHDSIRGYLALGPGYMHQVDFLDALEEVLGAEINGEINESQ